MHTLHVRTIVLALIVSVCFLFSPSTTVAKRNKNKLAVDYVNPFIGTGGHGHTYPGPTLPFGMVQLGPESGNRGWDWCSGYHYSDQKLVGFTHTHLSGTGCADLGDILFMPCLGVTSPNDTIYSAFSHSEEYATPGYYRVKLLSSGINVELTATRRAGFHRYTYPKTEKADIRIDLGYGQDDTPIESNLKILDSTTITGWRFSAGWAPYRRVFFVARFSKPFHLVANVVDGKFSKDAKEAQGRIVKGLLRFTTKKGEQILVKVGISAVDIDGAMKNLDNDIPDWNFYAIRKTALDVWQHELGKIKIETTNKSDLETFYTAFYHTMLAPTLFCDIDGRYRGSDGKIHQSTEFENYSTFSLWDTFRAAHPLYTIVQQDRINSFVQSLLAFNRNSGMLPIWPLAECETQCMIGYHSVSVIAEAYAKGFRGFDANEALEAMKGSAFQNGNGLEFYNLTNPKPLDKKLMEIQANEIDKGEGLKDIFSKSGTILNGYARTIFGEKILYFSAYSDVDSALVSRASTGTKSIEWETETIPADYKDKSVTFLWSAGLSASMGEHQFNLFVNDEQWFAFRTGSGSKAVFWEERSANGAELVFQAVKQDRYKDMFGSMVLKIPLALIPNGKPLRLRVVGEKALSPDWVMTFEHTIKKKIKIGQEYGIGKDGAKEYQFIRITTEHPSRVMNAKISIDANTVLQTELNPGVNTVFVPVARVFQKTKLQVGIEYDGSKQIQEYTLLPIDPFTFIPADREKESVSKVLEYAYDDWCIASMAKALNSADDYEIFSKRAQYYRSVYDSSTGFMRGRNFDGSWVTPFNPRFGTGLQPQYTEGNAWQFTWFVPHDVDGLIQLIGGKERFISKLDSLFHQSSDLTNTGSPSDLTGLIGLYAHGNEPSHSITYLYDYVGQPWKTQQLVRRVLKEFYSNKIDGICGNEDCGQMSAWYILSAMGFFPVNPVECKYVFGSPIFKKVTIEVGNRKRFTVLTENGSDKNIYVQSILLDGKPYDKLYLEHADIMRGCTLTFKMGPAQSTNFGASFEAMKP